MATSITGETAYGGSMTQPRVASVALAVAGPETRADALPDGVELAADVYRPETRRAASGAADAPALRAKDRLHRRARPSRLVRGARLYRRRPGRARPRRQRGHFPAVARRCRGWRGDAGLGRRSAGLERQGRHLWLQLPGDNPAAGAGRGAARPAASGPTPSPRRWAPGSIRDDWAYEGGAFRLAGNIGWACQMAAEQARLAGDAAAFMALAATGRGRPVSAKSPPCLTRWRATGTTRITPTGSPTMPPIGRRSRRPQRCATTRSTCRRCISAAGRTPCSTARSAPSPPSGSGHARRSAC